MDRDMIIAKILIVLEDYADGETDPNPAKEVLKMWNQHIDEIIEKARR